MALMALMALAGSALPASADQAAPAAPAAPVDPGARAAAEVELAALPGQAWEGWLALLHYRPDGDGGWQSEVRAAAFFLDEEGAGDPEREWQAARRAFAQPLRSDAAPGSGADAGSGAEAGEDARAAAAARHPQCRFPARFAFLQTHGAWRDRPLAVVACPDFLAFRAKVNARSLAVVFASHYLANPASAFGHAMLYLGSTAQLEGTRLADSSIGFEADTKGQSPLAYIPKGLSGGLTAGFRVMPFYDRVRKYERQELRDIWLFPLKLPTADLEQLVRHLWELREVSYQYGFFDGNCAQKILALVHAIAPRYQLLPFAPAAVLPSDVVRRLVDAIGLAGEPVLRPSLLGRYGRQRAALSSVERAQLDQMIESRTVAAQAAPSVLAAAVLWSELHLPHRTFRRAAEAAVPGSVVHRDLQWKRALLSVLMSANASTDAAGIDTAGTAAGPDPLGAWQRATEPSLLEAHAPSRVTLRGGYRAGDGAAFGAGLRWLLHEPLDPYAGYPQLSSLEVLRLDFGLTAKGEPFIDEATAMRVEKLGPASSLQSPMAWKLELGLRRLATGKASDDGARAPLHAGFEVAVGAGKALLRPRGSLALFAMLGLRPGATITSERVRFAPAALASAGLLLRLPAGLRGRVHAEYAVSFPSLSSPSSRDHGAAVTATARKSLARDLDLELLATWRQADADSGLGAALGLVIFR